MSGAPAHVALPDFSGRVVAIVAAAACVWRDLAAIGIAPDDPWRPIIAVNRMIADYPGRIALGISLHPVSAIPWRQSRAVRQPQGAPFVSHIDLGAPDRVIALGDGRFGTSSLYAVDIALMLGAARVVLCGAPIDDGPHIDDAPSLAPWLQAYRDAWVRAKPDFGGRVRSASGWSADLLGRPDHDWLAGVSETC